MTQRSQDWLSYLIMIAILFGAKAIEVLVGVEYNIAGQQVPIAGLLLYAVLGAAGVSLAHRSGFPTMWQQEISNKTRFALPVAMGVLIALGMVGTDFWLRAQGYPQLPQTQLPEGLLVVIIAGISEEIALRLFLIPLVVWLVSNLLLGGRWQKQVFWAAAVLAAILYAMLTMGALISSVSTAVISAAPPFYLLGLPTIFLYSLFAAFYLRRAGFLAVLSLRFGFYFVWHVLWILA